MNSYEKEKLLQEVFEAGDAADFRRQAIAQGVSRLRARRLRKRLAGAGVILCAGATMLFFMSPHQTATSPEPRSAAVSPAPTSQKPPAVQYVDDEQLLALFPHRPVALVGAPPNQRLIFLDKEPNTAER
jgi:hypothetical protein